MAGISEKDYYRNIDECAVGAINRPIRNGHPEHARYLMAKMFAVASERVCLSSGALSRTIPTNGDDVDVYAHKSLLDALQSFLRVGKELKVAVERNIDGAHDNPFIKAVDELKEKGELNCSVEVRMLPEFLADIRTPHFMVMDSMAYRVEFDHEPCNAIANFGDAKTSRALEEFFNKYLTAGELLYSA